MAISLLLTIATDSFATDRFWGKTSGGGFAANANWIGGVAAGANDVAHFGLSDPSSLFQFVYTVLFIADANTNSLLIEDDLVTFDLNAHTYTNNHSPFIVATQIGNQPGRFGELSVTDGVLDINSVLFVGTDGGSGELTITDAGTVQSDFFARFGFPNSSATVNVDGGVPHFAKLLHTGELSVGFGGTATMNVTGGGLVSNGKGLIADGFGPGTVTVSGILSQWFNSSDLVVGNGGTAALNIVAGGRVDDATGHISSVAGHTGTVTVDGTNTGGGPSRWINSGNLLVGEFGHGTLNITGGGRVDSVNAVIGVEMGSVGEVTVEGAGSTWQSTGLVFVSGFGPGTGTLTVRDGGTVSAQNGISVRPLGTLQGNGQVIGNVSNLGTVAPGTSPGALMVTGNFSQLAGGKLEIELAGTTAGTQYDQLLVSGAVALNGTLEVSLTGGFSPTSGMSFDILDWGSLSGTFANISLPALSAGLTWNTSQLFVTGSLSVGIPGDFNRSGAVDAADYVVWRKGLGTIYAPTDYNIWRSHFAQTAGAGSGAPIPESAVPEPASIMLMLFALLGPALNGRLIVQRKKENLP